VTDDGERQADGGSDGASDSGNATGSPSDDPPDAASGVGPKRVADAPDTEGNAPIDFGDLSLPQRVFVAAVQNPTRGVVVTGLFAFAFSFYIAFWMAFPRAAALMSGIGLVLAGIMTAVYSLSR